VVATSEPVSPTGPGRQSVGARWASPGQQSGGVGLLDSGRAASRLLAGPGVLLCTAYGRAMRSSCARR
jgi:hypothetical protein